jgi:hypothetical protein
MSVYVTDAGDESGATDREHSVLPCRKQDGRSPDLVGVRARPESTASCRRLCVCPNPHSHPAQKRVYRRTDWDTSLKVSRRQVDIACSEKNATLPFTIPLCFQVFSAASMLHSLWDGPYAGRKKRRGTLAPCVPVMTRETTRVATQQQHQVGCLGHQPPEIIVITLRRAHDAREWPPSNSESRPAPCGYPPLQS